MTSVISMEQFARGRYIKQNKVILFKYFHKNIAIAVKNDLPVNSPSKESCFVGWIGKVCA